MVFHKVYLDLSSTRASQGPSVALLHSLLEHLLNSSQVMVHSHSLLVNSHQVFYLQEYLHRHILIQELYLFHLHLLNLSRIHRVIMVNLITIKMVKSARKKKEKISNNLHRLRLEDFIMDQMDSNNVVNMLMHMDTLSILTLNIQLNIKGLLIVLTQECQFLVVSLKECHILACMQLPLNILPSYSSLEDFIMVLKASSNMVSILMHMVTQLAIPLTLRIRYLKLLKHQ